jgi:hypothetical protein
VAVDVRKLKTLVHYICTRCRRDPSQLGAVKLHKILWFADGQTYARLGSAILGEDYTREPHGPMSVHLESALKELEIEGHIVTRTVPYKGKQKREYFASGVPDISFLGEKEKRILDEVIRNITQDHSASSISEKTHDRLWEVAALGERIPYQQQLLVRFPPLTVEDQEWIKSELEALT